MSVIYVLTFWAYELRYWSLGQSGLEISDVERYLTPLIPVGILAGSIVVHELAHAIAMLFNGLKVAKIRLEIWGGYTQPTENGPSLLQLPAAKTFVIYFAGPCANLLVVAAIWTIAPEYIHFGEISDSGNPFLGSWFELAFEFNLVMALFNLLPVFPLDGGHVLRSILMGLSGSALTAGVVSGTFSLIVGAAYVRYIIAAVTESGWQSLQSNGLLAIYAGVVVVTSLAMTIVAISERATANPKSGNLSQRLITVILIASLLGFGYAIHFNGYWERLPMPDEIFTALLDS